MSTMSLTALRRTGEALEARARRVLPVMTPVQAGSQSEANLLRVHHLYEQAHACGADIRAVVAELAGHYAVRMNFRGAGWHERHRALESRLEALGDYAGALLAEINGIMNTLEFETVHTH